MTIIKLGIDTTNNNLCYALLKNDAVLFYENIYPCSNAAEILAPKIANMLKTYKITLDDISNIISVTGPGGFSGVRIGTAFVTGFVAQSSVNVIGITSLEAAALSIVKPQKDSIIIACLNARREGVYIAIFNHDYHRLTPDAVVDIADLPQFLSAYQAQPLYISGHGAEIIKPFLNINALINIIPYPLANEFTQKAHLVINLHDNKPIYLRLPDAKISQKLSWDLDTVSNLKIN
jgi:tRNA threonylcarbamoyladenosine biosynthesis protein TsaB